MNLLEQLRGNFPKTIDKNKPIFSALIANDNNNGIIQTQLTDLFKYMKEWISTPDIYKQSGVMLKKTVSFFSFLEQFAEETETSLKNRFAAIFIRNHDTRWGTSFDIKSVFKQYFPHATIYLVENTNKIDDSTPEFANLFTDGDINTDTPTAWNPVDCSATVESRFSKGYGMELNQPDGYFEQTVTVLNRKRINDSEPYEYKNLAYYLHFFLSGRINVKVYNSSNTKYWDNSTKSWSATEIQNVFEKSEWDDCSLFFITEGDDDNTDITITFSYEATPVASELEKAVLNGELPVTWNLINCSEIDGEIVMNQVDSEINASESILENRDYTLNFSSKGKVSLTIKNDNNKYWDVKNQEWKITAYSNTFNSNDWIDRTFTFTTENDNSNIDISIVNSGVISYLKNVNLKGELILEETLTNCTKEYDVVHMEQVNSVASYNTDIVPGSTYKFDCLFKGRCLITIQNDNNEYWDIKENKWKETAINNDLFSNDKTLHNFEINAHENTNEITIEYTIPNTYADYFRLFEKQPFGSFTVIAYFEGNTSVGVFGLAAGDGDPNIETESATPPQPRYGNYGYYDKSFLSGIPIGFASDIYEDLLDYLRAQGVKAYLDIVIKDYASE